MKQKLTAKEEMLMNIFWEHGSMFIRDLISYIPEPKPHYNTVATLVKFLEEKGFVEREPMANSFRYKVKISERAYRGSTVSEVVAQYYNNSYASLGRDGIYFDSGVNYRIFYAFYILVMRRTTFFRFNRAALLTGSLSCVLLPLLRVRTAPVMMVAAGPLTMTDVSVQADGTAAAAVSWPSAVLALYLTGAAIVIGHTLFSALALRRKVSGGRRQRIDGIRTVILEEDIPSFTFGKTVFIGRKDLSENPAIFRHETMHVKCRHYLDLFFFRAIQLVWWWNYRAGSPARIRGR